jgi:DNA polymerase-3 subunit alpha
VAEVCLGDSVRYVRLGAQFCVRDPIAAVQALNDQSFTARCSDRLVLG